MYLDINFFSPNVAMNFLYCRTQSKKKSIIMYKYKFTLRVHGTCVYTI